ncbi:MAG: FAD:protein FMN transferase, partial [Frankiaceae bacterium]|nr:FAD:protein FMN transferase [Frankiaceae bacterium]
MVQHSQFRAMACEVDVQLCDADGHGAADRVEAIFAEVQRQCTRFDPTSPLMLANAAGTGWAEVPTLCLTAIAEAFLAHEYTDGLFDPRVHNALVRLGYDRSLPFRATDIHLPADLTGMLGTADPKPASRAPGGPWRPGLDFAGGRVRIGPDPIDLGGIGKGLAVRWATRDLSGELDNFAIVAGGDCYLSGPGPEGAGWNVEVENPLGGSDPIAVLTLADLACATSSTRVRAWTLGGRQVHHLLDPRT